MSHSFRCLAVISLLLVLESSAGCGAGAGPTEGESVSQARRTVRSDISADEEVVFYPTYGHYDEDRQTWTIPIHGIIYEPENDSRRRNALVLSIRKTLQLEADESDSQFLVRRLRLFLADNERGQEISVRFFF